MGTERRRYGVAVRRQGGPFYFKRFDDESATRVAVVFTNVRDDGRWWLTRASARRLRDRLIAFEPSVWVCERLS